MTNDPTIAHLHPESWRRANRRLVAKALGEFAHELLLRPTPRQGGEYSVTTDDGFGEYRFRADRLALDHWQVDPDSITRHRRGEQLNLDALELVLDFRTSLGLTEDVLPVYLEEITSTLASLAYKLSTVAPSAAELARADFQTIEAAMTEGHPGFVANSGRIGFDSAEYLAYAPEAGRPVRLEWVAARRDRTVVACGAGLDYAGLLRQELGASTLERFTAALIGQGLDPADYVLVPVHPWQWRRRLSVTFAGEVAQRHLVWLGPGVDEYLAQQSIRTFFNLTAPTKHYVKTALSVLNMGFMRGLSAAYMAGTPAINDWLADVIARDGFLRRNGAAILRERAAVGYEHPQFHAATAKGSPYRKMLAALWRESPVAGLAPGERLATMASLLHVDSTGTSVTAALMSRSGLSPAQWLRRYLTAYLTPLLHWFYAHDLVFMPHGENVILVLDERGITRRALFKDIAEEVALMNDEVPLPPEAERIRATPPEELKTLAIFADVFDGFFRFLAAILHREGVLDQEDFWATVAACVADYQDGMPQLRDRFQRYDLWVAQFDRSCLNRLQLRDNQNMVDLDAPDPDGVLQFAGTLVNPIAGRRGVAR